MIGDTLQLRPKLRLDFRVFFYIVHTFDRKIRVGAGNAEIEHLLKGSILTLEIPVICFRKHFNAIVMEVL